MRTYTELMKIPDFQGRYEYLKITGKVGQDTFGFERYLNQSFYHSKEWKKIRRDIIIRDNGCDLGDPDREIISEPIIIHHMNPVSIDDIVDFTDFLTNPEFLISCTDRTHKAIHYGSKESLALLPMKRSKNDTCPWKK